MKNSSSYKPGHVHKRGGNRIINVMTALAVLLSIVAAAGVFLLLRSGRPQVNPSVSLPPVLKAGSPEPDPEPYQTPGKSAVAPQKTPEVSPSPVMLDYMEELYEINPDTVGYLSVDGTNIEGPVVYTEGEDYYLHRGFYGEDLEAGVLFVDKYNTIEPRDANLIIHGHNMLDGSMFHDLLKYEDESFYREHKIIRFDSLYEPAEYEVVAAFVSQVYYVTDQVFKYYKEYDFKDREEFSYFVSNIKALSFYDTGVDAKFGDEFITLSTCEYSRTDGRMVVVARKITP